MLFRSVRMASALLVGASIAVALALARRASGSWRWAALGVPLAVAGYPICEFFYDAPRVDPMSTLLVVVATRVAAISRSARMNRHHARFYRH